MKTKFLPFALVMGLGISLVNCGEKAEEKEGAKTDSTVVEEPQEPAYAYTYKVEEVDVTPRWAVTYGDSTALDDLGPFFEKSFKTIYTFTASKKQQHEPPLALFYDFSTEKKFYTLAAGYVNDSTLKVKSPLKLEKLYGGKALKVEYWGAYEKSEKAYADMEQYMKEKNMTPAGAPWEQYITDPMTEQDTTKWQTDIYFPVSQN